MSKGFINTFFEWIDTGVWNSEEDTEEENDE